ncbi:general odorant-binding protein 83a-like [Thrips palmi]|uniref:General odorant-binding protein 83a-like n=1 Tax=Thrips palmi TaxID=161013 RepID=A0A6P8YVX5_THRPL|nr:general odorant-binding protein 83a-like [Thrips palmi]
MKTLLAVAAALLAVSALVTAEVNLSDDQKALLKQLRGSCMEETGVAEATIEACKTGNFADDPKLRCYLKCVYQQMTVMDDDGMVDADMMVTMLPEEIQAKAEPILQVCKAVNGADACENAMQFNKCLYEKAPDYYIVP